MTCHSSSSSGAGFDEDRRRHVQLADVMQQRAALEHVESRHRRARVRRRWRRPGGRHAHGVSAAVPLVQLQHRDQACPPRRCTRRCDSASSAAIEARRDADPVLEPVLQRVDRRRTRSASRAPASAPRRGAAIERLQQVIDDSRCGGWRRPCPCRSAGGHDDGGLRIEARGFARRARRRRVRPC